MFLDKDGTLIKDVPFNVDPDRIVLEKNAASGLRLLAEAGFQFVIVSNQSGIARGIFKESELQCVQARLEEILQSEAGVSLAGFYYCPHHPQGRVPAYSVDCDCRKPKPGMLLCAAKDLGITLPGSWMIGDILNDIEAGHRAGCRTILIDNGNETEWKTGSLRQPDFTAANLADAAHIILNHHCLPAVE